MLWIGCKYLYYCTVAVRVFCSLAPTLINQSLSVSIGNRYSPVFVHRFHRFLSAIDTVRRLIPIGFVTYLRLTTRGYSADNNELKSNCACIVNYKIQPTKCFSEPDFITPFSHTKVTGFQSVLFRRLLHNSTDGSYM